MFSGCRTISHTGGAGTLRLWGCRKNRGMGFECDDRKKYQNPEKGFGSKWQDVMSVLQELSWQGSIRGEGCGD